MHLDIVILKLTERFPNTLSFCTCLVADLEHRATTKHTSAALQETTHNHARASLSCMHPSRLSFLYFEGSRNKTAVWPCDDVAMPPWTSNVLTVENRDVLFPPLFTPWLKGKSGIIFLKRQWRQKTRHLRFNLPRTPVTSPWKITSPCLVQLSSLTPRLLHPKRTCVRVTPFWKLNWRFWNWKERRS